ncbi:sulfite exporter TauE/SafE family protein [Cryobacterium sp. Hz9]|uniref:sulfite exporter TauE/SafE family protein n=1 Tax=Cryobacterium sp. Hz9 TaxID=1259167 RepID=UPI001F53EBD2|nr:sulfite exporter TauE/SafE family protein [Cryobacterium sp. Hz9]
MTSPNLHPALADTGGRNRNLALAFLAGAAIGILGGMIGLGGAEFRLPLLIGVFSFAALQAIIMNKAMSLIVVITAIPARLIGVPLADLSPHLYIVVNLLAGSLVGAWIGAHWATKLKTKTLYRIIAVLLVLIAILVFVTHFFAVEPLNIAPVPRTILGIAAGIIIGVVAALMGVAGGELLIPTIILLYGTDIKIAGSLSLAVSLPTMLVAFARFSRDQSFTVLGQNKGFLIAMTIGSITGTILGGLALGVVPSIVLIPLLVLFLLLSSVKVWNHK